jgi:hypothetical protein
MYGAAKYHKEYSMQYSLFEEFEVEERPLIGETKVCNHCKIEKELEAFYPRKDTTDKRDGRCKVCTSEASKIVYQHRKKYGHTMPEFCECCGKPPSTSGKGPGIKRLCVDHDHETGEFRGWLCFDCNQSIGKLGDNLEGLLKAVAYLKKAEKKNEKD